MKCFECRQELAPSASYLVKRANGSIESVECIVCLNIECDLMGVEYYQSNNIYYQANRAIEGMSVSDIVSFLGLKIDSSLDIKAIITKIKLENPKQLEMHKSGKKDLTGYFMGRLMKETNNTIDPVTARPILEQSLRE